LHYLDLKVMENKPKSVTSSQPVKLRIKYEELSAKYANQVIVNSTPEELYLDFSSGAISDPGSSDSVIPIHSRIAMSIPAARRLTQALHQTLIRLDAQNAKAKDDRSASLPKLESR